MVMGVGLRLEFELGSCFKLGHDGLRSYFVIAGHNKKRSNGGLLVCMTASCWESPTQCGSFAKITAAGCLQINS